ncbi:colicin E5-related ribonuclease [Anaerorhabdus sp.]|uniref:colicin E5-related ribonuclease n=1 Tax=Anaerorhabdus sp. TaxID=1872524 RepID=UPI002FC58E0A
MRNNQKIADAINNPYKVENSVNKFTGNSIKVYYIDDMHYVAIDNVTQKVVQVSDLNRKDRVFDLLK